MAVQGHPPLTDAGVDLGYADEEDALVEYDNEGYGQDQLDEQEFGGEGYPERLEGRPDNPADLLRLLC